MNKSEGAEYFIQGVEQCNIKLPALSVSRTIAQEEGSFRENANRELEECMTTDLLGWPALYTLTCMLNEPNDTYYHYTNVTFVCLSICHSVTYKREVTRSHSIRAKKFSFSASLDLERYNRQPTDRDAKEWHSGVAVVHSRFPEGGDSIQSFFSWDPLRAKLQDY